jgi:hypothetical protein
MSFSQYKYNIIDILKITFFSWRNCKKKKQKKTTVLLFNRFLIRFWAYLMEVIPETHRAH